MLRAPLWALLCCLAAADGLLGCDTACDKEDKAAATYDGGTTYPSCTVYETGAFDEKYLKFPAGRRWSIAHGLGQVPTLVKSYLAFDEWPLAKGGTAESAGNQVIIEAINDESVQVHNDTCETFWLRLVVEVSAPSPRCEPDLPVAGAGAAEGTAGGAAGAVGADEAGGTAALGGTAGAAGSAG